MKDDLLDLRTLVRAGAGVWWGQAAAEPIPLVDALLDQLDGIGPVRAFSGLTFNARLRCPPDPLSLVSYGAMGELRGAARADRLAVVPGNYSTLPRLFAERRLPRDVGLVQVSPRGAEGTHSLGFGADYTADALQHTGTLVAEVNHRMPALERAPRLPPERFAAMVETDRPLPGDPRREPDAVDRAIAEHVAEWVQDGDTLQVGVGTLPSAILAALTSHADLGLHSGMLTDAVLDLADAGVLTGRRKEIDTGLMVAGTAIGSPELYGRLADYPVAFRPTSYTHAPAALCRLEGLVAINAALQVDLTGAVGAESVGGRYVGGIGGQADFSGAASRTGRLSIIALRATAAERSTIVTALDGPVSTARADIDVVVTEYGSAVLRGVSLADRPALLASIAAPHHRAALAG